MKIKLRRGRGDCTDCLFLDKKERNCKKPKKIKMKCMKKRGYFVFSLFGERF